MKKKIFLLFSLLFLVFALAGCNLEFYNPFERNLTQTTTTQTRVNGTISFSNEDYSGFSTYNSDTYDLDTEKYNEVLLATRDKIKRSNIQVNTSIYVKATPWSTPVKTLIASGSGVIVLEDETDYYAITNYHVLETDDTDPIFDIKADLDSEFSEATLIAFDSNLDLALLKFDKAERTNIHIIDLKERVGYKFNSGELVLAVGNPGSIVNNVTFGEFKSMETLKDVEFLTIYHDAFISNGSSGGALVDVDGNLLGINTWGIEDEEDFSFAIPNYIVYMFLINNGILD